MNMDKILALLRASLPVMKLIAAMTPTPADDALVKLLENILLKPGDALAMLGALKAKGLA
jgi:hypothetical protein